MNFILILFLCPISWTFIWKKILPPPPPTNPIYKSVVNLKCLFLLILVFTEKYCTANHVDKLPGPRDWVQILQDQIKLARRRLKRGSGKGWEGKQYDNEGGQMTNALQWAWVKLDDLYIRVYLSLSCPLAFSSLSLRVESITIHWTVVVWLERWLLFCTSLLVVAIEWMINWGNRCGSPCEILFSFFFPPVFKSHWSWVMILKV